MYEVDDLLAYRDQTDPDAWATRVTNLFIQHRPCVLYQPHTSFGLCKRGSAEISGFNQVSFETFSKSETILSKLFLDVSSTSTDRRYLNPARGGFNFSGVIRVDEPAEKQAPIETRLTGQVWRISTQSI